MAGYETEALARRRRATDLPLPILAIGSLPLLLLELDRSNLGHPDRVLMDTVNVVVLIAFAVDHIVELAVAANRRLFARKEWTSLAIVIAQAIALVPGHDLIDDEVDGGTS